MTNSHPSCSIHPPSPQVIIFFRNENFSKPEELSLLHSVNLCQLLTDDFLAVVRSLVLVLSGLWLFLGLLIRVSHGVGWRYYRDFRRQYYSGRSQWAIHFLTEKKNWMEQAAAAASPRSSPPPPLKRTPYFHANQTDHAARC